MMDLRSLRHLTTLARRLSYVRAAEDLGITQPTLTRSIQALERELQVRLFDRDRGQVSLTPQGRQTAERAAILLADAEALEASARASGRGESGRIRFGLAPMPASALLPKVLADRLARTPEVINEVVVRDVEALWAMLVSGEIEFFVATAVVATPALAAATASRIVQPVQEPQLARPTTATSMVFSQASNERACSSPSTPERLVDRQ
jgi:DNA-binding transcriptional LysR family regulator